MGVPDPKMMTLARSAEKTGAVNKRPLKKRILESFRSIMNGTFRVSVSGTGTECPYSAEEMIDEKPDGLDRGGRIDD
jgi:hypothetical protein